MALTNREKKLMGAISHLPFGGLTNTHKKEGEIVAICWRWIEGDKEVMGWFDMKGKPVQPLSGE